jgi:UDP-N-acetyl-D-mannosaminuronic acid dehydrogenase
VIDHLNKGSLTFEEEGLAELFQNARAQNIRFTSDYQQAMVYIVAVPTPYNDFSKKIDPSYVIAAVKMILAHAPHGAIIIIESTISPGTIDRFIRTEIENHGKVIGLDIHLAHAPERIIPGNMVHELYHNSRTIGVDCEEVGEQIKTIYASFCKSEIIVTNIRTAEMSKIVENTYRDINIAFANELAKICRRDGMDVYEIIRIANKHPRVNILQPGPGVGGHCISVDPWFLVGDYPDLTNLILAARKINDSMPYHVISRIREIMKTHQISEISKIGLYGLSYKENVDDWRESPTLQLLHILEAHLSFGIKVYDPYIAKTIVGEQYHDFEIFLEKTEILVVMVGHRHLLDHLERIKDKIILDTKNILPFKNVYKL